MNPSPKLMFNCDWSFSEETLEQCYKRYSGFGIKIYEALRNQIPQAFSNLKFYQSDHKQTKDSYAICSIKPPFSIQLDPDIEVIVLGGDDAHTEIGAWAENPCEDAINFIRQHFIHDKQ